MRDEYRKKLFVFAVALTSTGVCHAFPFGNVSRIACAPTDRDSAAVWDGNGVWMTADGGGSWRLLGTPLQRISSESGAAGDEATDAFSEENALDRSPVGSVAAVGGEGEEASEATERLPSEENTGTVSAAALTALAASDSGSVAWIADGEIIVADRNRRQTHLRTIRSARDILFDAAGNLFAISDQMVFRFRPTSEGFRLSAAHSVANPRALIRGPAGSAVILTRLGLYATTEVSSDAGLRVLVSVRSASAAALARFGSRDGRPSWFIIEAGRLCAVIDGKIRDTKVRVPHPTQTVSVDVAGEVRIFSARFGWQMLRRGVFTSTSYDASAVDGAGRFWQSDPTGLKPPGANSSGPRSRGVAQIALENPPLPIFNPALPAPPRCRFIDLGVLPEIRLVFAGDWAQRRVVPAPVAESRSAIVSVGLMLTWRIGEGDFPGCLARRRRFAQESARLRRRAADLKNLWDRASRRAAGVSSIAEAVAARIDRDKAAALATY